jgi:uncharacterized membrane protein YhaH (DUF805 family)
MNLAIECVTKKFATFSGRARRKEYWLYILLYLILLFVAIVIDVLIGTYDEASGLGAISGILSLVFIIPSMAVSIRRLHDTERVGWWVLISFIPILGSIWFVILMCLKGTDGVNHYGPDPLVS